MKFTHTNVWKQSPKEKTNFVSNFVHHTYSSLKKAKVKKILDVACGNGFGVTMPLAKLGYEVHSIDKSQSGVKACTQNLMDEDLPAHVKKADMYKKLPYKSASFDALYCFQAIYHGKIEQIMITLSESARVLKNGGLFYATLIKYEDIHYDKKRKNHFFWVNYKGKTTKSWMKQDSNQPHLFYFLSKNWEYMVPHYFFSNDEIKCIFGQYFNNTRIRSIKYMDQPTRFWLVSASL